MSQDKMITITLSRKTAMEHGLLICSCGHPINSHFQEQEGKPCAHCECKKYDENVREGMILHK